MEEHRSRVFENRVLRRLHNEELHDLYASPNIIRVIKVKDDEIGRTCSTHGKDEIFIQYFGWIIRIEETIRKT
jgi:hypothetical protein